VKRGEVLVVGAGIGGLSAAIALRGKGFGVTILEIQPDLHSSVYGVGIIQPVNALRARTASGRLFAGSCCQKVSSRGTTASPRSG
jgi:2-polyprenyl-6-methoxyphenol hydroxylase-like FAD-dependent oxidoreductase